MIYAVDTNVLLDVFTRNQRHGPVSRERLREAYDKGTILVVRNLCNDELIGTGSLTGHTGLTQTIAGQSVIPPVISRMLVY